MSKNSLLKSFLFAFRGLAFGLRERNFILHLFSAVAVIFLAWFFEVSKQEWITLMLCIIMVLGFELLNTAIEKLTDLVSPEHHPLAGQAKDLAAAAVLTVSIGAAIVGLFIFIPYFFN